MFQWICAAVMLLPMGAVAAAVSVKPVRVIERRVEQVDPSSSSAQPSSELTVRLKVGGEPVKRTSRVGEVRVSRAVDDLGTNLIAPKLGIVGEITLLPKLRLVQSAEKDAAGDVADSFFVDVRVPAPSRRAHRLAHLSGQFKVLAGGRVQTVAIDHLKSRIGQKIDNPLLKEAGITLRLLDPKEGLDVGPNRLVVEFAGNDSALLDSGVGNTSSISTLLQQELGGGCGGKEVGMDLQARQAAG